MKYVVLSISRRITKTLIGLCLYRLLNSVMRNPSFCICEKKRLGHCAADQRLCFCYTDSAIILHPKSETPSLNPSSVVVQPILCRAWSEKLKTGLLATRLIKRPSITKYMTIKTVYNDYPHNGRANKYNDYPHNGRANK